jgi:tetratricopeptide (TPR) repeat protein
MRAGILGLTIVVAATAPAFADDKAKAKALYEQGLKAYNLAEYADAIKAWKESYSLSKKPLLLFNIGQAYRLDGDCKKATTFYDTYQREEPNPKNQDELDNAISLCAKAGDKPPEKPADKPPEKPVDKPAVTEKPKDNPTVVGQPEQPEGEGEVDTPEEPTSSGGGLRKIGIGVGAAGVVLGGIGIYFALDSKSKANELDGHTGEWTQKEIDLEKAGQSSATKAWITGGVGIAAIAVGGVLFAIGGPKAAESSAVGVLPTKGGAAVSWAFRF